MQARLGHFATLLFCLTALSVGQGLQDVVRDRTPRELPGLIRSLKGHSLSIAKIRGDADRAISEPQQLGSGFVVWKGGQNFAVTNYHVLKNLKPRDSLLIGANLYGGKANISARVLKTDERKDIAILIFEETFILRGDGVLGVRMNQRGIPPSAFADSSEIQEGAGVLLIGYPLNIGAEATSNLPVTRIGVIAQALSSQGTFLVDGIASHGNSGSPVFSIESGKLLGMVRGFPPDHVNAYDQDGNLIVSLPYNSGLTRCISAREILELIP